MQASVNLYANEKGELNNFLSRFYNTNLEIYDDLKWEKKYANPLELAEIIGIFIDNSDDYNITMWISLDRNIFIYISKDNANDIIKYLFERYPY